MGEQGAQEGAENTPLWGPSIEISRVEMLFPTFTTWGLPVKVQDAVVQGGVSTQGTGYKGNNSYTAHVQ
jgi:hypothetical protein